MVRDVHQRRHRLRVAAEHHDDEVVVGEDVQALPVGALRGEGAWRVGVDPELAAIGPALLVRDAASFEGADIAATDQIVDPRWSSIWPMRARSRALALMPAKATSVPTGSSITLPSCSIPS